MNRKCLTTEMRQEIEQILAFMCSTDVKQLLSCGRVGYSIKFPFEFLFILFYIYAKCVKIS